MSPLSRIRRLTTADYIAFVEAIALAVWIEAALKWMPVSWLIQRVSRLSTVSDPDEVTPDTHQRLARFVDAAYRVVPFPMTCLRQSLVLCAMLNRRRAAARLCLGVARHETGIDAHAWVECAGVLDETSRARFSELH